MMDENSDIKENISKLSDNELSDKLVEHGFERTPINNMTRKYLEKKLLSKLVQNVGRWQVQDNIDINIKYNEQSNEDVTNHFNESKDPPITPVKTAEIFYAVYCPNGGTTTDCDTASNRVFQEQDQALQFAKKNKKNRFKSFKKYDDALNFASNGINLPACSPMPQPPATPIPLIADGASRFKGPRSQDLVLLRKTIESGNTIEVERMIWENPRYLVGSGDTPSILQEGARYNALHISSRSLNAQMTALILDTISDIKFIQLLYGSEIDEGNCRQRSHFLLDLYLNTPDKGQNDTPLHIAVKFGAVDVVQVLTSFPECDKLRPNKSLLTPHQVICERKGNASDELRAEIKQLLDDAYFVPVLRCNDSSLQPKIGEVFSTNKPLVANKDLLSSHLDVLAYAGPMDIECAESFRKRWKTPPRVRRDMKLAIARINDLDKGLEREGRELAKQYKVKWREFWPFLGMFTDFSTTDGISKLEAHLKKKFEFMSLLVAVKNENTPIKINELENRSDILSPMSELCAALNSCTLVDKSLPSTPISRYNNKVEKRNINENYQDNTTSLSPIVYIEKTCHVLSRRLSDAIYNALTSSEDNMCLTRNLKEVFNTEILKMQKLINGFRSNSCFNKINFKLIHSRICELIPYFLDDNNTQSYDIMRISASLQLLTNILPNDDSSDDDQDYINTYRNNRKKEGLFKAKEQVACMAQLIIHALNRPGGRALIICNNDSEVMQIWDKCTECFCNWTAVSPPLTRAMRKGSSLKRNLASSYFNNETTDIIQSTTNNQDLDDSETSETEEINKTNDEDEDCSDMEEESFFTPPSSIASDDSDMEQFESTNEGLPVFLNGKLPTKLDVDVLRALDNNLLDKEKFPFVWRWKHEVMRYSEQERECWPSPAKFKNNSSPETPTNTSRNTTLSPICSPISLRTPDSLNPMWGSPEPPFASPRRKLNLW